MPCFNPLSSKSDQHQISPHHISAFYYMQVMRIRKRSADKPSWCLNKFSQLLFNKMCRDQYWEFVLWCWLVKASEETSKMEYWYAIFRHTDIPSLLISFFLVILPGRGSLRCTGRGYYPLCRLWMERAQNGISMRMFLFHWTVFISEQICMCWFWLPVHITHRVTQHLCGTEFHFQDWNSSVVPQHN